MNSTAYYVSYNITSESNLDMATVSNRPKVHLGGNSYMCRVNIIEGYTKAEKETFERIIRISENGAEVEVYDWTPADCDMYIPVNS